MFFGLFRSEFFAVISRNKAITSQRIKLTTRRAEITDVPKWYVKQTVFSAAFESCLTVLPRQLEIGTWLRFLYSYVSTLNNSCYLAMKYNVFHDKGFYNWIFFSRWFVQCVTADWVFNSTSNSAGASEAAILTIY